MRSIQSIRTAKISYVVMSSLFCVLGIVLIAWPGLSVSAIGIAAGILLVILGGVKLLGYFSRDLYRLAFQFDLALGLLLMALGVVVLSRPERAMSILCLILGIAVLSEGLFKLQMALDARRFGLKSWWLILAVAVLTGLFGLLLTFRPVEGARMLTMLLGVALLSDGVLNLITALCAVKVIRERRDAADPLEYR